MSSRNSPTLTLEVNGRRAEALAAWLMLATAGCTVVLLGAAPSWTQWLAAVAVGAIAFGLWRAGWIGPRHRLIGVRWLPEGNWFLADRHNTTNEVVRTYVWQPKASAPPREAQDNQRASSQGDVSGGG